MCAYANVENSIVHLWSGIATMRPISIQIQTDFFYSSRLHADRTSVICETRRGSMRPRFELGLKNDHSTTKNKLHCLFHIVH